MKLIRVYPIFLYFFVIGCVSDINPASDNNKPVDITRRITDGFCLQFGDSVIVGSGEIDYYDFSTHIIYLKNPKEFLNNNNDRSLANTSFRVFVDKEMIYTGYLYPAWSSTMPQGIFINYPFDFPGYAIQLNRVFYNSASPNNSYDPRNDDRIIKTLKSGNQYHAGISCTINEIKILPSNQVIFSFTITNNDNFNYYILSPDKMGAGLFHYFTNGLTFTNKSAASLQDRSDVIPPVPWDSWNIEWMDLIKKGESKTYEINYSSFDSITPGEYSIYFYFPGLRNVNLSDLKRVDGRIWLGGITIEEKYFAE